MKAYLLRAMKARGKRSIFCVQRRRRRREEDDEILWQCSDKEKRRKVFSGRLKFLIGFGNSACVSQVDEKLLTYKTISKK